jgi:hypothetical protein
VARRVPGQQGRRAGDARHLQRGPLQADPRFAAATARRCSSISPAPAPSAAASSRPARIRRRPISAGRMPSWGRRRSKSKAEQFSSSSPRTRGPIIIAGAVAPKRCGIFLRLTNIGGYGSRLALAEPVIGPAGGRTRWLAWPGQRRKISRPRRWPGASARSPRRRFACRRRTATSN